jgi:hypothetical protein
MNSSSSWAKAGIASLALFAASGAAQAEPLAYDKDKADLADSVVLNPQSSDEIEVGVANQANIYCLFNAGSKRPITFQVPEEYASFGYAKDADPSTITAKWIVLACQTGEAYMGEQDVVQAKQAEMWEKIQKQAARRQTLPLGANAPASTVIGPAGVVGADGRIKQNDDAKSVEGSENPGVGGRSVGGVLQPDP